MASKSPGKIEHTDLIGKLYRSNLQSDELLDILVKGMNVFNKLIDNKKISDDFLSLLVHLIARASTCTKQTKKQEVFQLLNMLSDSTLIKNRSIPLLVGVTCNNTRDHDFHCLLGDYLTILQELYHCMPHLCTTPQVIGLVDFLKEQVSECDDYKDKETMLGGVLELKKDIMKIGEERPKPKYLTKQDAEDKFAPPEDFRTMSVIPGQNDVLNAANFLRRNKVNGKYLNLDHYLDVQFRLYREDCVSPLRDALMEFKQKDKESRSGIFRLETGLVYRNVQVTKQNTSIESGEVFEIQLDPDHRKRINWLKSKRLIYGALLLFSFDRFNTIFFAIVAESERETLQKTGCFAVQVFKVGTNIKLPRNTYGMMIEATSAFFEAYKHVLKALQCIKEETFTFQRYLVDCEKEVNIPSYISKDCVYDLSPVIRSCHIDIESTHQLNRRTNIAKQTPTNNVKMFEEDWPSTGILRMDESQRKAFISALTKEFVLIQGPPGTGKTYLGLQIAKTLLHNSNRWLQVDSDCQEDENLQENARGPASLPKPYMLVVCYTNHALDQFVEGIVDFMPEYFCDVRFPRVVRFGRQCKNPKLEQLSIQYVRRKVRREFDDPRAGVLDKAKAAKRKIKEIKDTIDVLQSRNIVLWFNVLKCVLSESHANQFGDNTNFVWLQWLHVLTNSWYKEVDKYYQNQQTDKENHDQLNTIAIELNEEEFITVISEAEYANNQRYIDVDDVGPTLSPDSIGIDLDKQYKSLFNFKKKKKLEDKCQHILGLEKEKAAKELHYGEHMSEGQVNEIQNIWTLSMKDRWQMYRYWLRKYIMILHEQLRNREREYNEIFDNYKRTSMEVDEFIMQQASVIAMTTTNAARYSESLNKVGPLITIIEEAAEVPEAHIVTAISSRCKHLILIGDHKQLEPKPAVHELAIKFNLSVSLFERMVKNDLSYHCLQQQHRMRPEISELVRHIYDVLIDNENVYEYPPIKGVRKSLFFITHNQKEVFKDEGRSYSNEHEAEYLKELCLYLIKQGYKPSEITIIAAYTGQMFRLKEKMPRSKFEGVNICVLDNYQGEENEIILLSLVRSNARGDIGFLNRENRICVALSRAKQGLFIIGNSCTLTTKSKHWQTIIRKLQIGEDISNENEAFHKYKSFGKALPLYCQNHPSNEGILAESPSDFMKVKDGGCDLPCEFRLACGHACRYDCHPLDREHKTYKCNKQCSETCEEGHSCPKRCHFDSDCQCCAITTRELKCQHTINLKCHVDYSEYPCPTKVTRTLSCGHPAIMECCVDPSTVLCKSIVERELQCGHTAQIKCHVNPKRHKCDTVLTETRSNCVHEFKRQCHDTSFERLNHCRVQIIEKRSSCDHLIERHCFDTTYEIRVKCSVIVTVNRASCRHEYQKQCHDQLFEMVHRCNDIVTEQWLSCEHNYRRHCYDSNYVQNNTCQVVIPDKRVECGHEYERKCSDTNYHNEHKCSAKVEKEFPFCGHKIKLLCHQDVESVRCRENVTTVFECKHSKTHECYKSNSIKCTDSCSKTCKNGHQCTKLCHFQTSCDCEQLIKVVLEGCKHQQSIPCSADPKVYLCTSMVKKVLNSCGHTQKIKCHINPETVTCKFAVLKYLPECQHRKMVLCSENVSDVKCTTEVKIKLEKCGHSAKIKCWQKRSMVLPDIKCLEHITHTRADCGHNITVSCWKIASTKLSPCKVVVDKTLSCGHVIKVACSNPKKEKCDQKCEKSMSCGHSCSGPCHASRINDHSECTSQCRKKMLCGHTCQSKTCMKCSPCQKSCLFVCAHSKCRSKCIDPCKPCKEKCPWECKHYKCTKLCFEECNRQRCNNVCDKTLSCGHQCPGYCGEPCPLKCVDCKPEMYVFKDVTKDSIIVTLTQCRHSFDSCYLDNCMDKMKNDLLSECPCCDATICYHPRYERILKRQKMALEDAKKEVHNVRINSKTLYPACDPGMLTLFEEYTTSIATYLHVVQHTRRINEFEQEFQDAEELTEFIHKDIETTQSTSFKDSLQLSEKIYNLHIQWLLCLFTTNPELLGKFYIADWFPAWVEKPVRKKSKDFPPELVESIEIIFEENDGIFTDMNGHLTITGHDIVVVVLLMKKYLKREQLNKILRPFIADMEGDGYLSKTRKYPQLQNVVGIHSSDWTICQNGHAVSTLMDSSCVICKGNDNQQTQFQYDDGQHFVTHGLTKPKINRKTQVANVTGKKSTFCTDKQADFSEDVGDMNSLQRFKNPYISNSENFRGDRGQTRRGRGKGMEKAMQVVTTNEKTRKPNKPDKVHIPPSLKLHVEKGPKRDRKDKHNAQEGKKRFQNKTSARGRPNKRDGRDDNNGSSGRVHDQEDYIYYNGRSDGRSGEFNTDGYRDNNHNRGYQGFRGRGRGRGGSRGRGRGRGGRL
ncbi:NFX1-type zinc finger-containing protein 1-like isoform X2 [Mytilus californianus]|uniref:NFX1-type zinc finger-containing protein 1-like isoform X2 n=1 Tax=Mytilus californianus TaxID=6549 RepID=UPI0022476FD0|nr:NFX1-type zinc finger-containing protein 1-like isoform X2 [Mytilus californianus]